MNYRVIDDRGLGTPPQTLGADWRLREGTGKRKAAPSPLNSIKWHRVILDVSLSSPNSWTWTPSD